MKEKQELTRRGDLGRRGRRVGTYLGVERGMGVLLRKRDGHRLTHEYCRLQHTHGDGNGDDDGERNANAGAVVVGRRVGKDELWGL